MGEAEGLGEEDVEGLFGGPGKGWGWGWGRGGLGGGGSGRDFEEGKGEGAAREEGTEDTHGGRSEKPRTEKGGFIYGLLH